MSGEIDWDGVIKIVSSIIATLAALFALPKIFHENSVSRKSQRREEYEFSKKFISEAFEDQTCKKVKVHPLIVEQGYKAIYGERLSYKEILVLLNFPSPSISLKYYYRSIDFLELTNDGKFGYIKKYNSRKWRIFYKKAYYIEYFFLAMLAILPIIFANALGFELTKIESITKLLPYVIVVLFWAFSKMFKAINMEFAEYIMEEQAKMENMQPAAEANAPPAPQISPAQEQSS